MIHIKEAIIVEGKYDKIKLESIVDTVIVTTDGFGVFRDENKKRYIKKLAETVGIIILTDSDGAGRIIRNKVRELSADGRVINIYSPRLPGKEKRKNAPSREGFLGVEGLDDATLRELFSRYGVQSEQKKAPFLDGARLYRDGLLGGDNSSRLRKALLKELSLPENLTAKALADAVNSTADEQDYIAALKAVTKKD